MELNRLQAQLVRQVLGWLKQQRLDIGAKVSTSELARSFEVSRSPVRVALSWLAEQGVLEPAAGRGFLVAKAVDDLCEQQLGLQEDQEQQLYQRLVEDLVNARLPSECSEADLAKRYQTDRARLLDVLHQLDREGVAHRKPGRGWQFHTILNSRQAFDESYQYRKLLEPQAPLQPGFRLDLQRAAEIRARQQQMLEQGECLPREIFEANAEFHEFIASCANNRFLLQAVQQQNHLRRFVEYQYKWADKPQAVTKSCTDHLAILDALEAGRLQRASNLLWLHLDRTSNLSPSSTRIDTDNWLEATSTTD